MARTRRRDFDRIFAAYQATYSNELEAKKARLDDLVGADHWLSVGTYKEQLLRSLLSDRFPKRYEIGTGFVLANHRNRKRLSDQIDLLVWDSQNHAPFFRDGDFVIVAPEALAAAIEVKSTLDGEELKAALRNLDSLLRFRRHYRPGRPPHRSIFAFNRRPADRPVFSDYIYEKINIYYESILVGNALRDGVRESLGPNRRINRLIRESTDKNIHINRWIDAIAILNAGFIGCEVLETSGRGKMISYISYETRAGKRANPFSMLETSLLLHLLRVSSPDEVDTLIPGYATALRTDTDDLVPEGGLIVFPKASREQIGSITQIGQDESNKLLGKLYSGRAGMAATAE
jgi:hypothetical protein